MMKEFRIGDYIVLRLENDETKIYIDGELFNQCRYVLTQAKIEDLENIFQIQSVDELSEYLNHSLERNYSNQDNIPSETEFWAHCSNLQVWYENNYDTRLLHSNLSFPLLKKLYEIGDLKAKKVFIEEIAKRIEEGNETVFLYLLLEGYTEFLPMDYIMDLLRDGRFDSIYDKYQEDLIESIVSGKLDKLMFGVSKLKSKEKVTEGFLFVFEDPEIKLFERIIEHYNRDPIGVGEWKNSFFTKVGESISDSIKNQIITYIKNKEYAKFIEFLELSILNNLNKEDLSYLINDPKINLIEVILYSLKILNIDSMYFEGGILFSEKVDKYAFQGIKKKILEIVERNNANDLAQLIGLNLLKYVDIEDLIQIIQNTTLTFLENYLKCFSFEKDYHNELDNYQIKEYPNEFLEKLFKKFPNIIESKIIAILKSSNDSILEVFIDFDLLDFIRKSELKKLLVEKSIEKRLIEKINKIEREGGIKIRKYKWVMKN